MKSFCSVADVASRRKSARFAAVFALASAACLSDAKPPEPAAPSGGSTATLPSVGTGTSGTSAAHGTGTSGTSAAHGGAGAPATSHNVAAVSGSSAVVPPAGGSTGSAGSATDGKAGAGATVASGGGAGAAAQAAAGSGGPAAPGAGKCLEGLTTYTDNGPFEFEKKISGTVNEYIPKVPAGCKVPMIHLNNGTGATCSYYDTVLARLASNGFVALCYENANTGAGTFGLDALKKALSEFPDLIDMKIGSTGHSQGGMAAFNTLALAEKEWGAKAIYSGFAIEPASGFGANPAEGWETLYASIKSPMFMFSGLGTDTLVAETWVQQAFDAMDDSVEAYFWTKAGANHIATSSADTNEVIVPWFRWKLLGDTKACEFFKGIPKTNDTWAVKIVQNEQPCQ